MKNRYWNNFKIKISYCNGHINASITVRGLIVTVHPEENMNTSSMLLFFSAEVLTLQFRLNTSERSMDDLKEKNAG